MVLVDANIHIDVLNNHPEWMEWSRRQLAMARRRGLLVINQIIYAEIALSFDNAKMLDEYVSPTDFARMSLPWNAAFLAAEAHRKYRSQGGAKQTPLPDFYIGAHALVEGLTLLTRDATRYKTYFPKLRIIAP